MKKVEAQQCKIGCSIYTGYRCSEANCVCYPYAPLVGACAPRYSSVDLKKMVNDHPNLCQSHVECTKKDSGNFCANYPNSDIEYGWCFASNSEAEDVFFKVVSNSKFIKDFLKMPKTT